VLVAAAQVSGSSPFVTATHEPETHVWHAPVQATLQHLPSGQNVEAHCPPPVHAWPTMSRQRPFASHVLTPAQVSASAPFFTATHAPVAQVRHAPVHAASQHLPSGQKPDAHCGPAVQLCACFSLHAPVASHVLVAAVQLSASSAFFTAVHAPSEPARLHAWHWAQLPLAQHTPSTQKPEAQVAALAQP
jgi:hypothetical protein